MPPVLVLVGAPGSGKTTVGRMVAHRLGVPFRDTDVDVEAVAGCTISDIFVDEGEAGFRRREIEAVTAAMTDHDGVLSVGGGAVESDDVRALLSEVTVVHLTVGASEAAKRVGITGARPMLLGNVRATWNAQLQRRLPLYREIADSEVATDGLSPDEVASMVAARQELEDS